MPDPDDERAILDPDGSFVQRLAEDRASLTRLRAGEPWDAARLAEIEPLAHRLAGAAGVFGDVTVGEAAAALETCVEERREKSGAARPGLASVRAAIEGLADALDAALPEPSKEDRGGRRGS